MQIADITDTTATTTDSTKQRCCHRCHRPARNRIAEMWSSRKPDRSPSCSKITIKTADAITTTTTTTTTTMMTMKDCHRSAWSEWWKDAWKHCCQSTRKTMATRCNPADPPNRKRSTVDPFSTPYAASLLPYTVHPETIPLLPPMTTTTTWRAVRLASTGRDTKGEYGRLYPTGSATSIVRHLLKSTDRGFGRNLIPPPHYSALWRTEIFIHWIQLK